jgi:2-succinyl-5-enolpyruvyl-6-hydroxy-3-cyclohexene-1-carboxylate synthase
MAFCHPGLVGEGLRAPCTVLIGDQALLRPECAGAPGRCQCPVYVIVINNHSGAIFHFFDLGTRVSVCGIPMHGIFVA